MLIKFIFNRRKPRVSYRNVIKTVKNQFLFIIWLVILMLMIKFLLPEVAKLLSLEVLSQLTDHAGCGTPDVVLLPGDPVDGVLFARPIKGEGDMIAAIEQVV